MEKIIERVQKLLNLAGNNSNENEAAAAIEKAHNLLAEHNLTMMEIEAHTGSKADLDDAERGALNTETNFSEKYYGWLWASVAKAHYCETFLCRPSMKARRTIYTVVGRKVNAIVAAQLATYLCQTVRRLANEEAKKQGRTDHAFKNSFIAGAASRLCRRVEAMRYGDKGQQNALVLWEDAEKEKNVAAMKATLGGQELTLRKQKATNHDHAGLVAGNAAGERISLSQQLGAGSAQAALQ